MKRSEMVRKLEILMFSLNVTGSEMLAEVELISSITWDPEIAEEVKDDDDKYCGAV